MQLNTMRHNNGKEDGGNARLVFHYGNHFQEAEVIMIYVGKIVKAHHNHFAVQ